MYGIKANSLCNTEHMSAREWLEARMHGPDGSIQYTIGGSDVSVVYGVNPWRTPLELYHEKRKGIVVLSTEDEKNAEQKRMGKLFEPVIARLFAEETGFEVIHDQTLYQHPDYKWALANIDRLYIDKNGNLGILEIKTTHYRKADLWRFGVPYMYQLQARFYMFVLDLDCIYVKCCWCLTTPSQESATYLIHRDMEKEKAMVDRLEEFIFSLENGIEPNLSDYPVDPKLAIDAINSIYGGNANEAALQFDATYSPYFLKILELDRLRYAKYQELKRAENALNEISVPIIQKLKKHDKAICTLPDGSKINYSYKREVKKTLDKDKLKKLYPDIYEKCSVEKPKVSRGVKRVS